jgi:multiple sugar transport system permease protein
VILFRSIGTDQHVDRCATARPPLERRQAARGDHRPPVDVALDPGFHVLHVRPDARLALSRVHLALNQGLKGTTVFRTLFFLPSLTPIVASAVVWAWLYNPQWGLLNYLLATIGIAGPKWLSDPDTALPSLMIVALWGAIGGSTMIIFLAGLQGVPRELHEAAEIDGAATFQRFWSVTLPMISPTLFFNLVLGIIAALKVFATPVVMTRGGPNYATWTFILHLYQNESFDMGYASALAWIFMVLVVSLTVVNVRLSQRWVYYEGDVRANDDR